MGLIRTVAAGGRPEAAAPLPEPEAGAVAAAGLRQFLRAFASSCTAMSRVLAEELETAVLQARWRERVEEPVRRSGGVSPPRLVLVRSPYRQFFERLLQWLHQLTATHPERQVIVLIPELVQRRWYHFFVSHRAMRLKAQLLLEGGPHVSVMSTPWYPDVSPAQAQSRWWAARLGRPKPEDA